MSDEEIAFDDWEKEAELIAIDHSKEEDGKAEEVQTPIIKDNPEQQCDPHHHHLMQIERIKNMSEAEFVAEFISTEEKQRKVVPFTALLKAEKEFVELASTVGSHFKNIAKLSSEKVLPQSETVSFFEEFLQYLYPEMQWQSIETVKEKTKIVKKQKKEEEAKVRKLREKEMRLKRGFNKQEPNEKQTQISKAQQNQMDIDEGM